ncbi:ABC transporter permease [Streptomyces sp. SID5643]|uniref:ABC transporter permease n=1 Tax=Streptomyces sp. SID5643 TaxID=2690307 RepID=UPI00136CECA2|nr:ABC transporter permease [Streptomyces sp. SID5643]MZF90209.1 ABC transporter permease [Streptomyces sp. SID5643]
MTALDAVTAPAVARHASPSRGLVLAMLRLHRTALLFWLGLVAVAAGALLWAMGPGADAAWAEYTDLGCDQAAPNLGCDSPGPANSRYQTAVTVAIGLVTLLPLLTGAWAGGALIGRELENGTAQLAWTQSVSPARWLAAKLAVPALLLVTGTLTLTLLHRVLWSSDPALNSVMGWRVWHDDGIFEINGTIAAAQALAALALGILVGLLLRRALPALGVAVLAVVSLVHVLDALRPHLWPVKTAVTSLDDATAGSDSMIAETGALTASGARVPIPACSGEPGCETRTGITHYYADYHPASHFWPLQLMETGLLLAVAALATAASFVLLRRRTGAAV